MKKEEIASKLQYGDADEAKAAVEEIIDQAQKKSFDREQQATAPYRRDDEPDLIAERNKAMDLIVAKNRMGDARTSAEQGRPSGIRRHFLYRFPKIAENEDMYNETISVVDNLQRQGAPNEWETYERAAKTVLDSWNEPDELLTEDRLLQIEEKFFTGPASEPVKFVEPVPNTILEGTDPKQARGRLEAIATIAMMRGQKLDG